MSITNMLGKPLKHYAVNKDGRTRYFILALENETNPDECSVIEMDKLDPELRSELKDIVDSDDCQREVDIWRLLDTKFFMNYPKQTILSVLRALKVIKVLNSDDVMVLLPNDTQMTAKEVMAGIREYREKQKQKRLGYISETHEQSVSKANNDDVEKVKSDIATLTESIKNINDTLATLTTIISEMKDEKKSKK